MISSSAGDTFSNFAELNTTAVVARYTRQPVRLTIQED
jgi:hypothetical protein